MRDPTLPEPGGPNTGENDRKERNCWSSSHDRGALHALVSRLRAALKAGGRPGTLVESHPAGYRLAIAGDAVDAAV